METPEGFAASIDGQGAQIRAFARHRLNAFGRHAFAGLPITHAKWPGSCPVKQGVVRTKVQRGIIEQDPYRNAAQFGSRCRRFGRCILMHVIVLRVRTARCNCLGFLGIGCTLRQLGAKRSGRLCRCRKLFRQMRKLFDFNPVGHQLPIFQFPAQNAIHGMQHPAVATLHLGRDGEFVILFRKTLAIALHDTANRNAPHHRRGHHQTFDHVFLHS